MPRAIGAYSPPRRKRRPVANALFHAYYDTVRGVRTQDRTKVRLPVFGNRRPARLSPESLHRRSLPTLQASAGRCMWKTDRDRAGRRGLVNLDYLGLLGFRAQPGRRRRVIGPPPIGRFAFRPAPVNAHPRDRASPSGSDGACSTARPTRRLPRGEFSVWDQGSARRSEPAMVPRKGRRRLPFDSIRGPRSRCARLVLRRRGILERRPNEETADAHGAVANASREPVIRDI